MKALSGQKGLLMEYDDIQKSTTLPPFLLKTYMLVEDPATDEVISWNLDGTAFVVWKPAEFSCDILPTLFKHCNFSSFVRQLNTYGFRKVVTGRWEFSNGMFRKGARELLCKIRRRKAWASNNKKKEKRKNPPIQKPDPQAEDERRSSSTSSLSEYGNLVNENEHLRRENGALNTELTSMRHKCKELTELVGKYMRKNENDVINNGDIEEEEEKKNEGPKLFGVRLLGVHGKRSLSSSSSSSSTVCYSKGGRKTIFLTQPC